MQMDTQIAKDAARTHKDHEVCSTARVRRVVLLLNEKLASLLATSELADLCPPLPLLL